MKLWGSGMFRRVQRRPVLLAVPASDRPPGRGRRVARRFFGGLTALAILACTFVGVGLAMTPARADADCNIGGKKHSNLGPEQAGLGGGAWIPTKEDGTRQGPVPTGFTLWEVAGSRGLLWSYSYQGLNPSEQGKEFDRSDSETHVTTDCDPLGATGNMLAQLLFEGSRFMGGLTIGLQHIATSGSPFKGFYDEQSNLVNLLKSNVFIPAIGLGVVVAGIWVMTRMRRQGDARETYSGVIGSAVLVVGLVVVLSANNYLTLTEAIDKYTAEFDAQMLDLLANKRNEKESKEGPCYIPPWSVSADEVASGVPKEPGRPTQKIGHRVSSCMLYEMLLFNPWMNGQFGRSKAPTVPNLCYKGGQKDDTLSQADKDALEAITCNEDDRKSPQEDDLCKYSHYRCAGTEREPKASINLAVQQVIAQAYMHDEVPEYARMKRVDPEVRQSYMALWKGIEYAMADRYPQQFPQWRGSEVMGRMATGLSSFIMNVIVLLGVGIIAILTIFWHGMMFVAWIILPVVAAIAIVPPARRIVFAVLGILVQAAFLRIVFGLVLVLLLAIMNAIQISGEDTGLKIILMLIAAAALWKLMSALRSGAISPEIVRTSADQGMLPSDQVATDVAREGLRRTRTGTTSVVRTTSATVAGAREGIRTARRETVHDPGTKERRREVIAGAIAGAKAGRRTTTPGGVRNQAARDAARGEVGTPMVKKRQDKNRQEDQQNYQEDRQRSEQNHQQDQQDAERRHQEVLDKLENS